MMTLKRFGAQPSWVRYSIAAALGVLVLSFVQVLEPGGLERLTSENASGAMLRWAVPILLAGLGGLYSERAGVVNIGLEGMMVLGTWFGAYGVIIGGPWVGLLYGFLGGAFGGLIHAIATVTFKVDHIVSGVAVNLLAPGIVRFLSSEIFTGRSGGSITQSPSIEGVGNITVPFLAGGDLYGWKTPDILGVIDRWDVFFVSDIASFARGFVANVGIFTLLTLFLVPVTAWLVWRTRFGLRLRIAGEHPTAGESLGVNIYWQKYKGVVISGALAGLGGAFIAMELTGFYREAQVQGRGFIGLAALIFGNWRPGGVLVAAFVFGYPFGTALRDLDGRSTHALLLLIVVGLAVIFAVSIRRRKRLDMALSGGMAAGFLVWYLLTETAPSWLPNALPFATVLIVLVFAAQRLRMPAADGRPYEKGQEL
ncbi:MAG TPA: ABC transporter permease [Acidimicrobiia bacterium]|nr:ABC transporter permease [Acidimicrobiia bacterium]